MMVAATFAFSVVAAAFALAVTFSVVAAAFALAVVASAVTAVMAFFGREEFAVQAFGQLLFGGVAHRQDLTLEIQGFAGHRSVEVHRHLVILHLNVPNMISHISSSLAEQNINIDNLANRSKGDYACTLLDVENITDDIIDKIMSMEGIIRVIKVN